MKVRKRGAAIKKDSARPEAHDAQATGITLYAVAAIIALVGLADAIYLTVEHLTGRGVQCTVSAGCDKVLASSYATIGGLPLASFGALAYFTAFSLATLAAFGYRRAGGLLEILVALMLITSLWLLFVQAFVLRAFCDYCLLSAFITLTLTGLVVLIRTRAKRSS